MNRLLFVTAAAALILAGCGDSDDPVTEPTTDTGSDTGTDTGADTGTTGEEQAWIPAPEVEADETDAIPGLDARVRVVYDDRGIPHIYGETERDLAFAQGYVTAQQRLFQMHSLRMAGSGRVAELLGADSLRSDVFLRILKLRATAEKMAELAKTEHPDVYELIEAYAAGVNVWIDKINAKEVVPPIEVGAFGQDLEPWTPVDTMTITRLQTYLLGFGGIVEPDEVLDIASGLKADFDGTDIEGVEVDALNFSPPNKVPTITGPAGKPQASAGFDLRKALEHPHFKRIPRQLLSDARAARAALRADLSELRGEFYGSNNWVVSGDHTASGKPIVSNDPHLSLRNPAIFNQVHMTTSVTGTDYNISGATFAGAPGIALGTNGHIAWGATVFFSDVTDVYVEDLTADGKSVMFQGKEVAMTERAEAFEYTKPSGKDCAGALSSWLKNLDAKVEKTGDYACKATFTIQDVPHHGPLIPWTIGADEAGKPIAMSWRWTGFEPTHDLIAIAKILKARSFDDFKEALNLFGVGAQNWIYGGQDGDIGWYPSHRLPIRKHVAQCQQTDDCTVEFPPFLPMPGDGSAEWDGFVPRDELPQAHNPPSGQLVTANADPTGTSYDNNAFNDGHYLGYMWAAGFRMARAAWRVGAAADTGGITPDTMTAVQADETSNLGERLWGPLLEAMEAAKDETSGATMYVTPETTAAVALLKDWNIQAPSGVGADDGSEEALSAASAAVMNVFATYLVENALGDEKLNKMNDHLIARLLLRMIESPEQMMTWDATLAQSRLWDDRTTDAQVETQTQIMARSLAQTVQWLTERFGSADHAAWRWGTLHTLKLKHNLAPVYDIPAPDVLPDGFPRHGDMFALDAAHPGLKDRDFSYNHGPAIRHVMELVDPVTRRGAVPGGQNEDPREDHYSDQMEDWVKNVAPEVPYTTEDVLEARERIVDLTPAP